MLDKKNLIEYVKNKYDTDAEQPWLKYPENYVFRHNDNKKWYGLIMNVSGDKVGLSEDTVEILNLKCDSNDRDMLISQNGIIPAYHMSKKHWITIILDGSVDDELVYLLIEKSFELTK